MLAQIVGRGNCDSRDMMFLVVLLSLVNIALSSIADYVKHKNEGTPWLPPIKRIACGESGEPACNITAMAEACDAVESCNAFTSVGELKSCPYERCGCDSDAKACMNATNSTIYTRRIDVLPPGVPADWKTRVAAGDMLFARPEPHPCYWPEVGNGYISTVPGWGAMHIPGLFNGRCGTVHKAAIPSTVVLNITNGAPVASALDMREAAFYRLWTVGDALVLQRTYAHRVRRHILVTELMSTGAPVELHLTNLFDPLAQRLPNTGNGCSGSFANDFNFSEQGQGHWNGKTTASDDDGVYHNISIVKSSVPQVVKLHSQVSFITAVATSLEGDAAEIAADAFHAASAESSEKLFQEHMLAWGDLHTSGIDVGGNLDVATHANASKYFILSSVREDWPVGVSPGGAACMSYHGAIFMDMDMWMLPAFLLMRPSIAHAMLEYRFISIPVARDTAHVFGYNGTHFPWTSSFKGHPFGCCNGKGGNENCLEQHNIGSVAFQAWKYYQATGDREWLTARGWPLLQGVAEWVVSRVTPSGKGRFDLNGILPVDEWCVNGGCGCGFPGVSNDAFTNGVMKLATRFAAEASVLLGKGIESSWTDISNGIPLLWNSSHGHHDQFTSPSCPSGWGGGHYTAQTVCPEDVGLLSYPLGVDLGISEEVSRADAELFFPITCKENAGMTTPIHTIVWLALGEKAKAQEEFNRDLAGACYGPFLVRNEVDKHQDIIGDHNDNSHFLTGDGGLLQALLFGYGAIRTVNDTLQLSAPDFPEGVTTLTLRNMSWRGSQFTLRHEASVTGSSARSTFTAESSTGMCLENAAKRKFTAHQAIPMPLLRFPMTLSEGLCGGADVAAFV